ncbi:MAG: hypothetical protein U0325_08110 [Polyangiales bacterium]
MDPAIEAARALLPAWVPWANLALHPPLAFAATLLAMLLAAALSTRPGDLASTLRALPALTVMLPALWAVSAATAAGPIGRAPWWLLAPLTAVSSLVAAVIPLVLARRLAGRHLLPTAGRSDRGALRGIVAAVTLCAMVGLSLRGFAGQAWSRDREARVFAVAYTGGHDRTLADLAWITAQRGDQRGAAVLLRAALVAERSAVPAANLTIVYVNEGRCVDAGEALAEARRRIAQGANDRERALLRLAMDALRGCEGRYAPPAITGGS